MPSPGRVNAGTDVNCLSQWFRSPLAYAIENRHFNSVKVLNEAKADINAYFADEFQVGSQPGGLKKTILNIMELLVATGAEIGRKGEANIILPCILFGMSDINTLSKIVMEAGANIDLVDNDGNTLLNEVCGYSEFGNIKPMINTGYDVTITDSEQKTVLHIAVEKGFGRIVEEIVKFSFLIN